ncbi:MAG: RsmD family RNA methyltransferase [Spirochaetia bacterium]|nr:RsmD family RNA methyltransferase [Spirochaetia bacterium]
MRKSFSFVLKGNLKNKRILNLEPIKGHSHSTPQKVKEAVFQIIENHIQSFENTIFFDLYAGSGQMGIEAISRDATISFFCEIDGKRLANIHNWISKENREDKAFFIKIDALRVIKNALQFSEKFQEKYFNKIINAKQYNIVLFADPPYSFEKNQNYIYLKILDEYIKYSQNNNFKSTLLLIQTPSIKSKFIIKDKMNQIISKFNKVHVYGKNQILIYR